MNRFALTATVSLLLIAGCSSSDTRGVDSAAADARDENEKFSPAADAAADARREQILAELASPGAPDWAGAYYFGDGLGVNASLVLAPDAGYVFEWHGCLGLYDRNFGDVTADDGVLRLSFTFPNERKRVGIAPELIPVAWGARRYLIPADDVIGFCNEINQGAEPRDGPQGFFLLRRGDEQLAVEGRPQLPPRYRDALLPQPLEARVLAVGAATLRPSIVDWNFKDTPLTIDAGTRQGLRVGMELMVIEPAGLVESVRITKVQEDRADAMLSQAGEDGPVPKIGWRLSTRAPWRERAGR